MVGNPLPVLSETSILQGLLYHMHMDIPPHGTETNHTQKKTVRFSFLTILWEERQLKIKESKLTTTKIKKNTPRYFKNFPVLKTKTCSPIPSVEKNSFFWEEDDV